MKFFKALLTRYMNYTTQLKQEVEQAIGQAPFLDEEHDPRQYIAFTHYKRKGHVNAEVINFKPVFDDGEVLQDLKINLFFTNNHTVIIETNQGQVTVPAIITMDHALYPLIKIHDVYYDQYMTPRRMTPLEAIGLISYAFILQRKVHMISLHYSRLLMDTLIHYNRRGDDYLEIKLSDQIIDLVFHRLLYAYIILGDQVKQLNNINNHAIYPELNELRGIIPGMVLDIQEGFMGDELEQFSHILYVPTHFNRPNEVGVNHNYPINWEIYIYTHEDAEDGEQYWDVVEPNMQQPLNFNQQVELTVEQQRLIDYMDAIQDEMTDDEEPHEIHVILF